MRRYTIWGASLITFMAATAWAQPGGWQGGGGGGWQGGGGGGWQGGGGGWQGGWDDYSPGQWFPGQYDLPQTQWGGRDMLDVSFFYQELAPYGEWINLPRFGWCWMPYGVSPHWRPYTRGHWAYTEVGWTWVSYEPFGWATFHYGRWLFDPFYGWVWVPGTVWAPSWCAFRYGNGIIGWAPLPPEVGWNQGVGLNININIFNSRSFRRFAWNFIDERQFIQPNVVNHLFQPHRGVNFFDQTQDATNFVVGNNNTIINNSINIKRLERAVRRPIPMLRLADRSRAADVFNQRFNGRDLSIFRPKFAERQPRMTPDKLFGNRRPETNTWSERMSNEERLLQQRLDIERNRMQQRQTEMQNQPPPWVPQNGLDRWIRREQDAFKEREAREKNLVEREKNRIEQPEKQGFTTSKLPKYITEQPPTRKVITVQPGENTGVKDAGGMKDVGSGKGGK